MSIWWKTVLRAFSWIFLVKSTGHKPIEVDFTRFYSLLFFIIFCRSCWMLRAALSASMILRPIMFWSIFYTSFTHCPSTGLWPWTYSMPWLGIHVWSKNLYNLVSFLFLIIITLSFGIHKPGHFLGASQDCGLGLALCCGLGYPSGQRIFTNWRVLWYLQYKSSALGSNLI